MPSCADSKAWCFVLIKGMRLGRGWAGLEKDCKENTKCAGLQQALQQRWNLKLCGVSPEHPACMPSTCSLFRSNCSLIPLHQKQPLRGLIATTEGPPTGRLQRTGTAPCTAGGLPIDFSCSLWQTTKMFLSLCCRF